MISVIWLCDLTKSYRLGLDPKVVTNVSDLSHVALPCSHVVLT